MQINKVLIIISWFVFFHQSTTHCYSQNSSKNFAKNYKEYSINDGFEVYHVHSMEFDNDGWLWVSGTNLDLNSRSIDGRKIIIQRSNGSAFYSVPLPDFSDNRIFRTCKIVKRTDGYFYVIITWIDKSRIYLLNPKTLKFEEINFPVFEENREATLFPYKDYILAFIATKTDTKIFKLTNSLEIIHIATSYLNKGESKYFSNLIGFEKYFLINEVRSGVHLYREDGTFLKTVTLKDLGIKNKTLDYVLNIKTWFRKEGVTYVKFYELPDFYSYNPISNSWEKEQIFNVENNVNKKVRNDDKFFVDAEGNILRQELYESGLQLTRYLKDAAPENSFQLDISESLTMASRDLSKELFVGSEGKLYHFNFANDIVSTFLKNKSIRGILQLNDDKILVATEKAGWFTINLKTKETQSLKIKLKNQAYLPTLNRGIFKAKNGFWSNYDKGIMYLDSENNITSYINFPIAAMVEDENSIYYGTFKNNLMRFDKNLKKNIKIIETTNYSVQGIFKTGNTIFLTTEEGLLVYENKKLTLFKPNQNSDDSFLITINYHKIYGLLVGSKSGKLYQFNPENKKFTVLYNDKLKATIASVLLEDDGTIWLNTFQGVVSFNPTTKNTVRYSMNDGFSFYECNRYSALQTADGHFLVGTLKGLNYFHPKKIEKNSVDANLKLTLADYSDGDNDILETSPQKLDALKVINLPPNNKNLYVQYGLLGIYDTNEVNYRYRLNNQDWINMSNKTEIRLFNLSSGIYTLQIEALDAAKAIIGTPLLLKINAKEFFFNTFWFYSLVFSLILWLILWYYFQERKKYKLKEIFSAQIINSQENERSRISKELHDSIGQQLLILKNTFLMKNKYDSGTVKMIEEAIKEVREMSHNLHPFQFEKLGLQMSLENLMNEFQKNSHIFYSCSIENIAAILPKEKELFIFRMIQECVANVEKHSKATACNLTVTKTNTTIKFQLKDNGIGFIIDEKINEQLSLGLKTLKERAQYIKANFEIKSEPAKGTIITITVHKI